VRALGVKVSSYADNPGASGSQGVKWSTIGTAGKQIVMVLFSILLARVLGPSAYGIVAQAIVLMTLMSLLLDQGVSAALISSPKVSSQLAGAASSLNLLLALVLAGATIAFALPIANFFETEELVHILWVLSIAIVLKALAIVPRMLLSRSLNFRAQAVADLSAAIVGGVSALGLALNGWGFWALVAQIIIVDGLTAVMLLIAARPPLPNGRLDLLRETAGFSTRVFASNLIAYTVQNLDNVLIAKFLGTGSLAYYSLSYRVLTTPVQMAGQVVTRVLFPAVSRIRHSGGDVTAVIARSAQSISLLTFPAMALVAASANQSVPLLLGAQWIPAAPVLSILAIGGARQSVTTLNSAVMMGMGRADVALKFSLVAAFVQISGIIVGLQFGIIGVAAGLTVAGFVVTPIICVLQKRIALFQYRRQWSAVAPAIGGSLVAAVVYTLTGLVISSDLLHFLLGTVAGLGAYVGVLVVFHRSTWEDLIRNVRSVSGGGK